MNKKQTVAEKEFEKWYAPRKKEIEDIFGKSTEKCIKVIALLAYATGKLSNN